MELCINLIKAKIMVVIFFSKLIKTTTINLLSIFLIITILLNPTLVSAEENAFFNPKAISKDFDFSLFRNEGKDISINEMGWQSWEEITSDIEINQKDLLWISVHLRDISRSLGSSWSAVVSIPNLASEQNSSLNAFYELTDLLKNNGKWISASAGYALKLVTQELVTIESATDQPLIDFLVRDDNTQSYRPLRKVPLDSYCKLLLHSLKI